MCPYLCACVCLYDCKCSTFVCVQAWKWSSGRVELSLERTLSSDASSASDLRAFSSDNQLSRTTWSWRSVQMTASLSRSCAAGGAAATQEYVRTTMVGVTVLPCDLQLAERPAERFTCSSLGRSHRLAAGKHHVLLPAWLLHIDEAAREAWA